jgi:hypothetical protein
VPFNRRRFRPAVEESLQRSGLNRPKIGQEAELLLHNPLSSAGMSVAPWVSRQLPGRFCGDGHRGPCGEGPSWGAA